MPFDWREYLELAKDLAVQRGVGYSSEAAKRSAVSRAYYSAFCLVRNYAEAKLGFQRTKGAKEHTDLRNYLQMKGKVQLVSCLVDLRRWRNACDYDDEVPNLDDHVRNAIDRAEKAIQECR